ncbi:hypothetical protein MJO28_010745 [Puccinia striiformis f. sp. tritici]|uniref:Uncharacterized protein n=1 Tax=Puccinia striiformis f. sp. tritici TaxID=168172 RepID=A0ACC0E5V7_9BASI|nr:hypothetical protein MJO28_010745 [Puccinia striiformis f. sp. tritici]
MDQRTLLDIVTTQSKVLTSSAQVQLVILQGGVAVVQEENQRLHDEAEAGRQRGGSRPGRSANIQRNFEAGYQRLYKDYFAKNPLYNDYQCRRRFRMHRSLFLKIVNDVTEYDQYFVRKADAAGKLGLYSLQKITSALRILADGEAADRNDEYLRIGESTSHKSLERFCKAIIAIYGDEYLREPNEADTKRLLLINKKGGFPGMLGSLDCMHWEWKNCPTAWAGQYQGKEKVPTLVLEAVVSQDLWFWHAFFGLPGAHNDRNVLDLSPLFQSLLAGKTPPCQYTVNGTSYNHGYYLADGIYPDWTTLIKTISQPQGLQQKYFAKMQEAARKDVERGFGVLQARFAIVARPGLSWSHCKMQKVMRTCIILHNMIVEDERDVTHDSFYHQQSNSEATRPASTRSADLSLFIKNYREMRDSQRHFTLRDDLIAHLWARKGKMTEDSSDSYSD